MTTSPNEEKKMGQIEQHPNMLVLEKKLQAMSALLSRAQLAARLGKSYYTTTGYSRDLYEALGYEDDPSYEMCAARYERQDIAAAVINRPANATWQGGFEIIESDDDKETKFEKEWKELIKEHKLPTIFKRLDKLCGIGTYGVLFFGLDDVRNQEDLQRPVSGKRELLYLKPLGQDSAKINTWESNTSSPRYGLPTTYKITIKAEGDSKSKEITVHHSRVLHITDELLESEIEGVPRLRPIFNRLMDLEKLLGGSAEMFWRGARPGFYGKQDPEFEITADDITELQDQLDEYEHNLRRVLIGKGIDIEGLAMQVADPSAHVDIQIQMISAVTGIPKRVLTGTERGELASTQDTEAWYALISARREEFAENKIIRPFIDKCIELGITSDVKEDYTVKFADLWSISEEDQAKIGEIRARTLKSYGDSGGAADVVPPEPFLKLCMGFNENEVKLIEEFVKKQQKEEEEDMKNMPPENQPPVPPNNQPQNQPPNNQPQPPPQNKGGQQNK